MRRPLFFHVREAVDTYVNKRTGQEFNTVRIPSHTYCIDAKDGELHVGYAVVHEFDQFNKKTGRRVSQDRMNFCSKKPLSELMPRVHEATKNTMDDVLQKASELLSMSGTVKVKICCAAACNITIRSGERTVPSKRRTILTKEFKVKTETDKSNEIMHQFK